jgi:hypothetical protein
METETIEMDLEKEFIFPVIRGKGPVEPGIGKSGPDSGDGNPGESGSFQGSFYGRPVMGANDTVDVPERPEARIRVDRQGQPGPFGQSDPGSGAADGLEERLEKGEEPDVPGGVPEI